MVAQLVFFCLVESIDCEQAIDAIMRKIIIRKRKWQDQEEIRS